MKPGSKRKKAEQSEGAADTDGVREEDGTPQSRGEKAPDTEEEAKFDRRRKVRKTPYSPQISSRSIFTLHTDS
ncbi:MAG: hypothetical protein P4L67_04045 [Candidatus Pacebacteria bacterium]|nr:hypothetical protein [Candidatus Paceibacterota bacterium]